MNYLRKFGILLIVTMVAMTAFSGGALASDGDDSETEQEATVVQSQTAYQTNWAKYNDRGVQANVNIQKADAKVDQTIETKCKCRGEREQEAHVEQHQFADQFNDAYDNYKGYQVNVNYQKADANVEQTIEERKKRHHRR